MKKANKIILGLAIIPSLFLLVAVVQPRIFMSTRLGLFFYQLSPLIDKKFNLSKTKDDQLEAYMNYIIYTTDNTNAKSGDAQWKFLSGGGLCDQLSNIFIRLVEPLNIRAYTKGILWPQTNKSHHAVPFFTPNNMKILNGEELHRASYIYDPMYKGSLRDKQGNLLKVNEICKIQEKDANHLPQPHKNYYNDGGYTKPNIYCNPYTYNVTNTPIGQKNKLSQTFLKHIVPLLPITTFIKVAFFSEMVQQKAKKMLNIKMDRPLPLFEKYGEFESWLVAWNFASARVNHIYLKLDDAKSNYDYVIKNSKNRNFIDQAKIFNSKINEIKNFLL